MKIAILCFGQPRFLDLTHEFIKQEFDLPGHTVDYFFHVWEDIGYIPEDSLSQNYDKIPDLHSIIKSFSPKMWRIEQYNSTHIDGMEISGDRYIRNNKDSLRTLCKAWETFNNFVTYNRDTPVPNAKRLEYFFGQHYSMQKCFSLIEEYERMTREKYDIVIKIRTDVVYRTPNLFKSQEVYNMHKIEHYTKLDFDIPMINVKGLRINRLNTDKNVWVGEDIDTFYKNRYCLINEDFNDNSKYIDFDINTRICFNDWTLIANRKAATYYFGRWFENYLITYGEDLLLRKDRYWFKSQSDHTLQGHIALYNNIKAARVNRRDVKLIHQSKLYGEKGKDSLANKILVPEDKNIDIAHHIKERWKPTTKK
tara:strand:- start:3603 stop:4700 length:1098 start_codon:yes stop_codon:yes gene_type:complete